jgi:DNA helicase INO80
VTKPSEIVQLLLNDEQLASLESSNKFPGSRKSSEKQGNQDSVRDLWNEEGDDFFGHTAAPTERQDEENIATTSQSVRGKRRKQGVTGVNPRKKPGPKKKTIPAVDPMNEE